MTNEQLKVLITSWRNRIEREINFARDRISDNSEKEPEAYIGDMKKSAVGGTTLNPKEITYKPTGDFIALVGFKEFLNELDDNIEGLTGKEYSNPHSLDERFPTIR